MRKRLLSAILWHGLPAHYSTTLHGISLKRSIERGRARGLEPVIFATNVM